MKKILLAIYTILFFAIIGPVLIVASLTGSFIYWAFGYLSSFRASTNRGIKKNEKE